MFGMKGSIINSMIAMHVVVQLTNFINWSSDKLTTTPTCLLTYLDLAKKR
jgi:hypothetical protein